MNFATGRRQSFPPPTCNSRRRRIGDRTMMNPLNRRIIDQWHHVARSGDFTDLDTMIHEDAVFESPVVHTPQRGKAITIKYLTAAVATLKNPSSEFVGEWSGDKSVIVEFKSEIEGIAINGIDMIRFDETGLITCFKVMIRPLKAVNLIHRKMGEMLVALQ
jgi:hypothetical protein